MQDVLSREYSKILHKYTNEINDSLVNLISDMLNRHESDIDNAYIVVPRTRNIDAIRAEAERRYPDDEVMAQGELSDILTEGFVEGAMWALGYEYDNKND